MKVNYERFNDEKYTTLEDAETGDVIIYDDILYVVTDHYLYNGVLRGIVNILSYSFGELDYTDKNVTVKILKNAEITIKY